MVLDLMVLDRGELDPIRLGSGLVDRLTILNWSKLSSPSRSPVVHPAIAIMKRSSSENPFTNAFVPRQRTDSPRPDAGGAALAVAPAVASVAAPAPARRYPAGSYAAAVAYGRQTRTGAQALASFESARRERAARVAAAVPASGSGAARVVPLPKSGPKAPPHSAVAPKAGSKAPPAGSMPPPPPRQPRVVKDPPGAQVFQASPRHGGLAPSPGTAFRALSGSGAAPASSSGHTPKAVPQKLWIEPFLTTMGVTPEQIPFAPELPPIRPGTHFEDIKGKAGDSLAHVLRLQRPPSKDLCTFLSFLVSASCAANPDVISDYFKGQPPSVLEELQDAYFYCDAEPFPPVLATALKEAKARAHQRPNKTSLRKEYRVSATPMVKTVKAIKSLDFKAQKCFGVGLSVLSAPIRFLHNTEALTVEDTRAALLGLIEDVGERWDYPPEAALTPLAASAAGPADTSDHDGSVEFLGAIGPNSTSAPAMDVKPAAVTAPRPSALAQSPVSTDRTPPGSASRPAARRPRAAGLDEAVVRSDSSTGSLDDDSTFRSADGQGDSGDDDWDPDLFSLTGSPTFGASSSWGGPSSTGTPARRVRFSPSTSVRVTASGDAAIRGGDLRAATGVDGPPPFEPRLSQHVHVVGDYCWMPQHRAWYRALFDHSPCHPIPHATDRVIVYDGCVWDPASFRWIRAIGL